MNGESLKEHSLILFCFFSRHSQLHHQGLWEMFSVWLPFTPSYRLSTLLSGGAGETQTLARTRAEPLQFGPRRRSQPRDKSTHKPLPKLPLQSQQRTKPQALKMLSRLKLKLPPRFKPPIVPQAQQRFLLQTQTPPQYQALPRSPSRRQLKLQLPSHLRSQLRVSNPPASRQGASAAARLRLSRTRRRHLHRAADSRSTVQR